MRRPLLLFLFLNAAFVLTSTGRIRTTDEEMTFLQSRSLVRAGTTAIPEDVVALRGFYGKRDREGRARAPYGPLHAIAAAPFTAVGDALLARAPGVPADAADFMAAFGATLSSATFAAAAAALALALLEALGLAPATALAAALALALGTPLFAYSAWLFSEPLATALLVGAALALFGAREGGEEEGEKSEGSSTSTRTSTTRACVAGLCLGAAVLVRPTHVIAAPVFLAAILARDGRRGLRAAVTLAMTIGACVALTLANNWRLFGSPFDFGYAEHAEGGKRLNGFDTPLGLGLAGLLASPGKSVFLFAPPAIAALAGLRATARRDRGLAVVCGGAPLVYLLFYARYTQWEGGFCFGPRYLVPALALLCLALGPYLAEATRLGRAALAGLAALGCAVQLLGIGTSFLEAERDYYGPGATYNLLHDPLVAQARLLERYVASGSDAPLGYGLDRWFCFLAKAGVSRATLVALALPPLALAVGAGIALARSSRGSASGSGGSRDPAGACGGGSYRPSGGAGGVASSGSERAAQA